jgi:FHA domain
MTTNAPIRPHSAGSGPAPLSERPTAPLASAGITTPNPVSLLDHRSLQRLVPRHLATAGPHLGLQDQDGELLMAIGTRIMHIGRSASADVRFEEAHVSRRHAIVVRHGRHVRVLDDRSSTGTFVNGQRIMAVDLNDGDVIRLGTVALRYVVVP